MSEGGSQFRLRRLPGFGSYWASTVMAGIASSVGGTAVPLIAATMTGANALQMAVLGAAGSVPSLLLQVPAAVWADAPGRRGLTVLVAADCCSALLSLGVPLAWYVHRLDFAAVLVFELALALVGVVRFASQTPVLVRMVPASRLVDANGKLAGTRSAVDVGGQGLTGGILSVVASPVAMLVNAIVYLISALMLGRVPTTPLGPGAMRRRSMPEPVSGWRGIGPIVRRLRHRPDLGVLCMIGGVNGLMQAVVMLYLTRELAMAPRVIAWCIGAGAIGGMLGGFAVGRIEHRLTARASIAAATVLVGISIVPLAIASPGAGAIVATITFEFAGALGGTIAVATVFGSILGSSDPSTVSRTMAAMNNGIAIVGLTGLALGGYLGTTTSLHTTITAATTCAGGLAAATIYWAAWARRRSPTVLSQRAK